MFVIPGIVVLVTYVYLRPHEVYPFLNEVSFPMVLSFAFFGYLLDVKLGVSRPPRSSPLLLLMLAFFLWAIITIALNVPDQLGDTLLQFTAPIALFFLISQGVGGLRGLAVVSSAVLLVSLVLAGVAIQQGFSPTVCIVGDVATAGESVLDERQVFLPCTTRADCVESGGWDVDYLCERIGVMGTTSIDGRVRYRGIFQDPNELAWALSMSVPFAFAWLERRPRDRRIRDGLLVGVALVAIAACNVLTQSRSGQLSLIATLGIYFLRRFGWRGVVAGVMVAVPILALGGRTDESSTNERLECWAQALDLWRQNPLIGIGARQFAQHHHLTAHNSALLPLAEMGPLGLVLFTAVIYLVFKLVFQVQRDFAARPEAQAVRISAFATLAGLTGMLVSALFLSLTYHVALWMELALATALQTAVLRHDPGWRLRLRWRDAAYVVGIDVGLVVGISLYLRLKGV